MGGRSFSSDIFLSATNGLQPLRIPNFLACASFFSLPSPAHPCTLALFFCSLVRPIVILSEAKSLNKNRFETYS